MTGPVFGSTRTLPAERHPFTFTFRRDDVPEQHQFKAIGRVDALALVRLMQVIKKDEAAAVPEMIRFTVSMMDNTDGVPAQWEPTELPPPKIPDTRPDTRPAVYFPGDQYDYTPPAAPPVEQYPAVKSFRGPDGNIYPMEEAGRFTRFESGSSRRRWKYLLEQDDAVTMETADLIKMFEWMASLAGKGPTPASS